MYNIEKFQCELYDKYCSKKTDVETSKMTVFYFLTILYIYVYIKIHGNWHQLIKYLNKGNS